MNHQVRRAQPADASGISDVIIGALRESNARDYTPEIIARLELSFSPSAVERMIAQRDVFVGMKDDGIVGTASLDGQQVRTVFVSPDVQGRGLGRLLMQVVEATARERHMAALHLSSSLTAEPFYARLGYAFVREALYGDERTIVMEKILSSAVD
jgi:N-acetylglutamate synthase-like GNAT family acetyltransferase